MVVRNSYIRFPHTFAVYRDTVSTDYPYTATRTTILTGIGNVQTGSGGGMTNEAEAMLYDYVMFHKETLTQPILANDIIEYTNDYGTFQGRVMKSFPGQLTDRIWFNEISN